MWGLDCSIRVVPRPRNRIHLENYEKYVQAGRSTIMNTFLGRTSSTIALCLALLGVACERKTLQPDKPAPTVTLPADFKTLLVEEKITEILGSIHIEPRGAELTRQQLSQLSVLLDQFSANASSVGTEEPRISVESDLFASLNSMFGESIGWHLIAVKAKRNNAIDVTAVAAFVQQH